MKNNMILSELSNTQRISLKPTDGSVIIQKEFRKNSEDDWSVSKGIEISRDLIPLLVDKLSTI